MSSTVSPGHAPVVFPQGRSQSGSEGWPTWAVAVLTLMAVAAVVLAGVALGRVARTSSSTTTTCAAPDPGVGRVMTGAMRAVRLTGGGEMALPERPPLGSASGGHWYAVACGQTFSNIEWRAGAN